MTNLNQLAVAAKESEIALWEIKAHFMPLIERLTSDNWHKMNNEVNFMDDCYRRIEYAVRSYDPIKGAFEGRVQSLLQQGVRQYCGNRGGKRKILDSMEYLVERTVKSATKEGSPDQLTGFDVESEERSVEDQVVDNITSEELAQKYSENEMDKLILEIIFNADEAINQSEITRKLAEKTGRTFDSARGAVRSFIKRKKAQVNTNAA